jgi:hypothetical protein
MAQRESVSAADWSALAGQRIFFAHQSVGANILRGVADLADADPQRHLRIQPASRPEEIQGPGLYETAVGRNGDPRGKIDHFAQLLDGGLADSLDVAFMKLCYVDINENTDIEALFSHYRDTMAGLRARHPDLTIVHVTSPLQGPPAGFKTGIREFVKNLTGKGGVGPARNARREAFNDLMRSAYEGREPVFDLARVESTRPDGGTATLKHESRAVPRLAGEYTYDGGHLNESGRRFVAGRLLAFLARPAAGGSD